MLPRPPSREVGPVDHVEAEGHGRYPAQHQLQPRGSAFGKVSRVADRRVAPPRRKVLLVGNLRHFGWLVPKGSLWLGTS